MTASDGDLGPGRADAEAPAVPASDTVQHEEYALTASLLPHVLALRVSWPRDPENPAPGVAGGLVQDGGLWRVKGVPSPGMPLSIAVLSLIMGRRPGLAGRAAMTLADRAVSAYLAGNPGLATPRRTQLTAARSRSLGRAAASTTACSSPAPMTLTSRTSPRPAIPYPVRSGAAQATTCPVRSGTAGTTT